jgi:hypothetical protein
LSSGVRILARCFESRCQDALCRLTKPTATTIWKQSLKGNGSQATPLCVPPPAAPKNHTALATATATALPTGAPVMVLMIHEHSSCLRLSRFRQTIDKKTGAALPSTGRPPSSASASFLYGTIYALCLVSLTNFQKPPEASMSNNPIATTPVEIWRRIFEHAFDHPKLHYSCDPKDLCEFMSNYSGHGDDSQTNYRSLRAVCRSWKALAEEFIHREALLRIRSLTSTCLHLSRATRLQCHWYSKLPPGSFRHWLSEATPKLNVIDMTFLVDGEPEKMLLDTLSAASSLPSIRSLRLRWRGRNPPSLSSHISMGFTNLVSLEIGILAWPLTPLILPKLEVLIMETWEGYLVEGVPDLTRWSLPTLRMLGVYAGHLEQGFNLGVFRPIATKVEALSIIYSGSSYMKNHMRNKVGMSLFENFPTLRLLFIRDAPFIINDPVPIGHPLTEIHLSNSDATDSVSLLESTRFDHGSFDHNVRFIVDSVTWKDIRARFSSDQGPQLLVDRHRSLNLVVVDKLGRSFEEYLRDKESEIPLINTLLRMVSARQPEDPI